jgi:hypothetical protein
METSYFVSFTFMNKYRQTCVGHDKVEINSDKLYYKDIQEMGKLLSKRHNENIIITNVIKLDSE